MHIGKGETDSKSKAMYFPPSLPKKMSEPTNEPTIATATTADATSLQNSPTNSQHHGFQHHSNTNRPRLKLRPTLHPPHPIWHRWWLYLFHGLLPLPRHSDHPWSTRRDGREIKNQESNSTSWHPKTLLPAPRHRPWNKDNSIYCYGTQHGSLGLQSMDHHRLHQTRPPSIHSTTAV
jgi:hypothetical protein